MRKTFQLTHPKIKRPRLVEGVKHEVRKYLKRERKKSLPEGADFWDFDCKYGETQEQAEGVHVAEIDQCIERAEAAGLEAFYLEIFAKPATRSKRPVVEAEESEEAASDEASEG